MASITMQKFDPEEYKNNVYEAFGDFVNEYAYEYDAIAKEPPKDLGAAATAAWIQQNKRKIFLGKFASRNLQKDFEEAVEEGNRSSITFEDMVKTLKTHYDGGRNKTLSNYEFHKLQQKGEESFDTFVIRVKREAVRCDFKCTNDNCNVMDVMIRDQIVIGTRNDEIRKNALKNQWNLDDLVKNGRALESATWGANQIKSQEKEESSVARIKKPGKYSRKSNKPTLPARNDENPRKTCLNCSSKTCRSGKTCPAFSRECFDCGKEGHFRGAMACKNKSKQKSRRVHHTESNTSESSDTEQSSSDHEQKVGGKIRARRFTQHVTKIRRMRRKRHTKRPGPQQPRYEVEVIINGQLVKVFADTGADISLMSKEHAKSLGLKTSKTKMKIKPYGSKPVKCHGCYIGTIMYGDNVTNTCIYIIDQQLETLLSGRVSEELGIIQFNPKPVHRTTSDDPVKEKIASAYPHVFADKVGTLKDYEVKFYIDEEVKPVAQTARPVPFHLRKKLEREILQMEKEGIIEEHEGPAPWISNVVLAPKDNGGTRVTVDMREANCAIKPTNIPIPRVEDIRSSLSGCKVFSKVDFKSAFHQLVIDKNSRYITVFHAGQRLMRYRTLTMGSTPASGELSKALIPLFKHIPEVHVIQDDLLIATTDEVEHERALHQVLQVIQDSGMTLNLDKCLFYKPEIPFWGVLINEHGMKPDPEKVNTLRHATPPENKEELVSFLCMVQSNKEFIPDIARNTPHLRALTKKHKRFIWDKACQKEFEDLRNSFSEKILMNHFDPSQKTYILADAHISGLSAILMQGDTLEDAKPVACASRATSTVEQRYPQLDLEALAIDFALRRYRYYCVGGPAVTIITDHKPLVGIFKNSRKGSIRSDRIKLRHQDVRYEVQWKKGKENAADYLSRHSTPFTKLPKQWKEETKEFEKTIWFLQYAPYTESISFERIINETEADPELKDLKKFIKKGYIPKSIQTHGPFRKLFSELSISDEGLILKGDRIVLPSKLQSIAIKKAHQGGHPGMNGLKRRLRGHFWFPHMDKKVEEKVKACKECIMFTNKTTHEPIHAHRTSNASWQDVSVDLFGPMPNRKHVVAVIDKTSRFPAAKIVPDTSASAVTKALSEIYADFGQPNTHQTDNGPPFNSEAFTRFSEENSIQHIKTYPYHPQGNPVENFMRPLGKCMKAAHYNAMDKKHALNEMLSTYRATPHPSTGISPGNMIFRSGYKKDFPRTSTDQKIVEEALQKDKKDRESRGRDMNMSNHRMHFNITPNELVYARNNVRNKFDPIFGPDVHKVIDIKGSGTTLLRLSDSKILRRHLDDLKPAHIDVSEDGTCWIEDAMPVEDEPQVQQPQDDNLNTQPLPLINGGNEQSVNTRPQRERQMPAYYRDDCWLMQK